MGDARYAFQGSDKSYSLMGRLGRIDVVDEG
jgi:hypothetical protein